MSFLMPERKSVCVLTKNIWVPRRGVQWKGEGGFISNGLMGAIAASRRRSTAAGYTLLYDSITGVSGTSNIAAFSSGFYYFGGTVTDSITRAIGKITYKLTAVGTISGKTWTVKLWNKSGSNLGTLIGISTGVTGNNSWSTTSVDFIFSPAVSVPTGYYFTIDPNGAAPDSANRINIFYAVSSSFVAPYPTSSPAASWWDTTGTFFNNDTNTTLAQTLIYTSP